MVTSSPLSPDTASQGLQTVVISPFPPFHDSIMQQNQELENREPNSISSNESPSATNLPLGDTDAFRENTEPVNGIDHDQGLQIRLVPNVGVSHYCFVFDVIERTLLPGTILKLGRYSDKKTTPDRLSFKSKVVSRSHAELWMEDGKIYIRDAGSSSGTFVNRARLSRINTAGHEIIHGDIIQLGVDYKGGQESMYRAVRMRLEVNRQGQQQRSMPFTRSAFQQLQRQLVSTDSLLLKRSKGRTSSETDHNHSPSESLSSLDIQECCICLYAVAPFQALFISPCSHIFHYRCLRPILTQNYPGFSCPLCRNYSDLEANVALEMAQVMEMLGLDPSRSSSDAHATSHTGHPSPIIETEEDGGDIEGENDGDASRDKGLPKIVTNERVESIQEEDREQGDDEEQGDEAQQQQDTTEEDSPVQKGNDSTPIASAVAINDASGNSGDQGMSKGSEALLSTTLIGTPPAFETDIHMQDPPMRLNSSC